MFGPRKLLGIGLLLWACGDAGGPSEPGSQGGAGHTGAGEAGSAVGGTSGQGSGGADTTAAGAPDAGASGQATATGGGAGDGTGGTETQGGSGTISTGGTTSGGVSSEGGSSEGGSSEGGSSGGEANGGAGGESVKPLPGSQAFARDNVLEFRLTLADSDWTALEEHGDLEEYVEAAATVSGTGLEEAAFARVGLRHKGAYSLHHCWDLNGGVRSYVGECSKLSYKIKFDEYSDDSRLDGLKRINLHASSGDDTKVRELLAYDLFREFGVDAPRATPARVYINDEFQGLFIAVEDIDGRYTKAHFPAGGDGNLYKEVWPRSEAGDPEFVSALETNEDAADVSDMRAFAEAIQGATPTSFASDMASWVDIEALLRYIAVDRALRNWDGIMSFYAPLSPHNFFWYHDDGPENRFHLIPWDLDNTFWAFDPYMYPEAWVRAAPIPDFNSKPANCEPRSVWEMDGPTHVTPPRCDPLINLLATTQWQRFTQIGDALLSGPLKLTTMNAKVAHWLTLLEPIVAEDPYVDAATWETAALQFPLLLSGAIGDFRRFLALGLIEETDVPSPDSATTNDGLHIAGITNFEFATGPVVEPVGVSVVADPLTVFAARWNTASPLSGEADLRLDFTFTRTPGTFNEWVNLGLTTPLAQEVDIRGKSVLTLSLSTDVPRNVRVRIASPAYDQVYGGAWSEFGVDIWVDSSQQVFSIPLAALAYPGWAKEPWTSGQGWLGSDDPAKDVVLSRCNGLIFVPNATVDLAGELASAEESGHLQIDNVYFQ